MKKFMYFCIAVACIIYAGATVFAGIKGKQLYNNFKKSKTTMD